MKIFAMYDKKAGFYLTPFCETSTIAALRGFEVAVNNASSIFSRFPDDFHLHELASFNQHTGQIEADSPQDLGSARTVLKQQPIQPDLPLQEAMQRKNLAGGAPLASGYPNQ